jgi:hypothetical protein
MVSTRYRQCSQTIAKIGGDTSHKTVGNQRLAVSELAR